MSIDLKTAMEYLDAGLCVLPAIKAEKRPAVGSWKKYQNQLPSKTEVNVWFSNHPDALCVVTGKVSGNLEVIDFDNGGEMFPAWKDRVPAELLQKLVIEKTPSGGYHVLYRCEDEIGGNLKLAQGYRNDKQTTLIETRGNGGLCLCAPSDGYALEQGSFLEIPILDSDSRKILLQAAWELDETEVETREEYEQNGSDGIFEIRPGDDFNQRGDIPQLLTRHGWKLIHQADGNDYFQRPGKTGKGWSASLKDRVFYVFSSNAAPFEQNEAYSPFRVYTLLEHGGDYSKAAESLLGEGFGKLMEYNDVDLSKLESSFKEKSANRILTLRQLRDKYPKMREPVIHGVLRVGETMNIIAAPKTGKSWLAADLAMSVAGGLTWFGFPCEQGKVLIIDNELHPETSANRIPKVISANGVDIDRVQDNFYVENQRGKLHSINDLQARLPEFKEFGFKVIIIDAFYRAIPAGIDENDNGKIASVYNTLDRYANELNCSFILIHHSSKGNQALKSVTDVGAGAGTQARATDTHFILRKHQQENVVVVESVVRSFPPINPFCLCWDFPIWRLDASLDPRLLDGAAYVPEKSPKEDRNNLVEQVAALATNEPIPKTMFITKIWHELKISKSKARDALEETLYLGLVCENQVTDPDNPRITTKNITLPE